jgi:tetratricopeptide (TPR) repeat protein
MATFNSPSARAAKGWPVTAFLIFLAAAGMVFAGQDGTTNAIFATRARAEYHRAQTRFQADSDNATNAWLFACACYDAADFATNATERALLANQGIDACRQLAARTPKSAPAHYYLAMNLGQLARTELIGALFRVREMEREFKTAVGLDPLFDYAGPERNLGLLYLQAPTIGSIGSKRKAREFLERAARLAPDYPENHLNLAEAFLQWNEPDHAKVELNALAAGWSKAQTNFTGEAWAQSWDDWSRRRAVAEKTLGEISRP